MTSRDNYKEAYVWIWLLGEAEPVVAGILQQVGNRLLFNYGRSYLARQNAISIYDPELPLQPGEIPLAPGLSMPGSIRDASPDAWGRRVLINRKLSVKGEAAGSHELGELTYLLESGSDRAGALDFQTSATHYVPRGMEQASLDDLLLSAEQVEQGVPLSPDLDRALQHGTSLGGARPKALLTSGNKKFVAKFSMSTDIYNVVKAEYVAMRLAAISGLNVSHVQLAKALGKDVLLVERFDREPLQNGWGRKAFVSALTMLELDEMMARHASYELLAEIVRHRFQSPREELRELFGRLVFNILCGNTDDHARNHAAFWDGKNLRFTPAYDVCPQSRLGEEAGQGMRIIGTSNRSQLALCLQAAPKFLLSDREAQAIILHHIDAIRTHWHAVCAEADLTATDRAVLFGRQFLNPFAFYDAPEEIRVASQL
ncbi:MAG: HipA domain-containing protein [Acidobacteriota bacterium]|nr:HipA domain-containing protein [Acidobacteriota bacterium]